MGSVIFGLSLGIREKKRENGSYFLDLYHVKFPANNSLEKISRREKKLSLVKALMWKEKMDTSPLQLSEKITQEIDIR
jgi:hypothetical protein